MSKLINHSTITTGELVGAAILRFCYCVAAVNKLPYFVPMTSAILVDEALA